MELIASGVSIPKAKNTIFAHDVAAIEQCHVLLLVMDGRVIDEGASSHQPQQRTIFLSYQDKPVIGLIEHIYRVSPRARCVLGGNARCTRANRGR